ncbi:MAG: nicotinamide riboside transporter PnuC [Bacteroidales bacterium]|nr:nicotinamide riboside transporter PnuC [Bacteroidales bacterium]
MEYSEIFGAVTGVIYVLLEIKQKRSMWIVGAVSALFYTLIFLNANLFAAMGLQIYFLFASAYGWWIWKRKNSKEDISEPIVVIINRKKALISSLAALAGFLLLWFILKNYSSDPMPATDALIAALSMLATYWVTNRFIQHWHLWIAADVLAIYMYFSQGLYATTALYFIYIIAAVAGIFHWRKFRQVLN